ncbi:DNA repair nucleotidyltransferase [Alteromonas sp. Mex14]|nr:DNA repair nucleotidyltransferase [Alteromonas sp. Mex14]
MLWAYIYCYQLTLDSHNRATRRTAAHYQESCDVANNKGSSLPLSTPVVVYCSKINKIVQCNDIAKTEGIEIGHGLAQAAALCPYVHVLPFNEENERHMLTQLAHRLYPLASDIVLDSHACAGGLAIRLDNLTHYYGGHEPLWKTLTQALSESDVRYHFGCAWTIEAAKVLALQKYNTYVCTRDDIKKALNACPLSLTALAPKVIESLARVGITSVQQLLAMPVQELGRRFDNNTIMYLTALRGETFPRVTLFRPLERFDNFLLLPFDVENIQHLTPFVTQQLEHLSHYLRARNLYTSNVAIYIQFREAPPMNIEIQSALPQSSVKSWLPLFTLKIENLVLPEPATAVELKCHQFEEIDTHNGDFFSDRFNDVAQKQLIGRLNAKLGDKSTFQPRAANSHQFEYMTVTEPSASEYAYACDTAPTFTFDVPTPLTQPTQICFGPLRLNSEWWHDRPTKRDYFIAQTPQRVRLLVFKDEESRWWVQGLFC